MGDDGKISVNLRLLLDQLRADVAKASGIIKAGLGNVNPGKDAEKAGNAMDKTTAKVRRTSSALDELKRKAREAHDAMMGIGGFREGSTISGLGGTIGKNRGISYIGHAFTIRDFMQPGMTAPQFSPATAKPPPIPIAPSIPAAAKGPGMFGGIADFFGKAAAPLVGFRVALGLITYAVREALAPLKAFISLIRMATDQAARFYASQLRSGGLPLNFVISRNLISKILGVGENEVFQYSAAFQYLNDRLSGGIEVLSKTNPALTQLAMEFRILEVNISAIGAALSSALAPQMMKVIHLINLMVEAFAKLAYSGRYLIKWFADALVKTLLNGILGPIPGTMIKNAIAQIKFPNMNLSAPVSSGRMQTSMWERMGMVIGNGPATNYVKQTATHTGRMVTLLEAMHSNLVPRTGKMDYSFQPRP